MFFFLCYGEQNWFLGGRRYSVSVLFKHFNYSKFSKEAYHKLPFNNFNKGCFSLILLLLLCFYVFQKSFVQIEWKCACVSLCHHRHMHTQIQCEMYVHTLCSHLSCWTEKWDVYNVLSYIIMLFTFIIIIYLKLMDPDKTKCLCVIHL